MLTGFITRNGKVIAETNQTFSEPYGVARWAHLIGWNVDHYDATSGKLSNDSGTKVAKLTIVEV